MPQRPKILCVVPAFNEAGKIGLVVKKTLATGEVDQICVVDDCSTDGTFDEAKQAGAHVIRHEVNQGVGAGIRTGLMYGLKEGFDIGVILSGDDQHEPRDLPAALAPLLSGEAQFVQGSRRLRGGGVVDAPFFREVTTRIYSLIFTVLTMKRITDATNGFRAFFLNVLETDDINLNQSWLNTYGLEPYLLYKAVRSPNVTVCEVPITIYYRGSHGNYSKMRFFRDWWHLARPMILLALNLRS